MQKDHSGVPERPEMMTGPGPVPSPPPGASPITGGPGLGEAPIIPEEGISWENAAGEFSDDDLI